MIPTVGSEVAITLIIVTLVLIAVLLLAVFVLSTGRQQRRYRRTREHLGGRLLTAHDEERAAIARELHDDTVQQLIAVASRLRATGAAGAVDSARELDCIVAGLRGIARGIHPSIVDHVGIGAALADLCDAFKDHEGLLVSYQGPQEDDLPAPERLALYRVAQEALGNVVHHAQVHEAEVRLSADVVSTRLTIRDHGRGCDLGVAESGPGIGITSMRERLEILGGSLQVVSSLGHGTTVTAVLPRMVRKP
jgi:signal transduction histidine kinase